MNYKLFLIILAVIAVLITSVPSKAFEENFQYYPSGDISSNWIASASGDGSYGITTLDATYNRVLNIADGNGGGSGSVNIYSRYGIASNYWSFVVSKPGLNKFTRLYDSNGILILDLYMLTYPTGLWEISKNGNDFNLRISGIDKGIVGSSSNTPYYIGWYFSSGGFNSGDMSIDDITTSGYISGIGTESTSHTLTESNLNPTNISFTLNTFPFADYTSSSFKNIIQKYTGSTPTTLQTTIIKNSSNITIFQGFTNYNRETQLTTNDTDYGLYFSYTQKNGATVASDYFFLVPPGASNSITTPDTSVVIGQTEPITYSIGAPDFIGSSYSVNVYSLTALVTSIPISSSTGTVNWDTSGNSNGLYFITLSKTTSGIQSDLAYTTATLVSTLLINGKVYDAQNATAISGANINVSQGGSWFNTTSAADGSYNLSGLFISLNTNINASKTGYTHNDFSFTPLAVQVYTINLYMISNGLNCSIGATTKTCVVGITEDYPYHQAVPLASVNLGNGSYFATTTSNETTGFYIFQNLYDDNLSYIVNATKTNYQNSIDYNVTTINQTFKSQIIIMNEIFTLTIVAQDSTNANTIFSFIATFNGSMYNTSVGTISIPGIIYGQYPTIVSSTGYLTSSQNVLVDSTKTQVFILVPVLPATSSTVFKTLPHDVSFIVQDLGFNKKPGVYVNAQGYNTTVGNWAWLAELIGIDFDKIPINNVTMTGNTGTDGSIDFKMDGSIYYIITFSGGGISNITWGGYPTQYQYYIIVPTTFYGTFTNNIDQITTITTSISTNKTNSTSAYVNASYNDSSNQTSSIIIYLNQSIIGDPNNQTNLQTRNGGTNATYNASFTISPYAGKDYIVTFYIVHSSGTVIRSYGVSFPPTAILSYFNPISILMLLIGLVIFFAGIFGQTSTEQGSGIIVGLVWLLSGMGIYSNINLGVSFYLGLTLATVIAILMNINARSRKEGMS